MTMRRIFILSLLMTGVLASGSAAAELKEVELIDGSVITGEVLSLSQGVYTIRTESLGTVKVGDAKVRTIRPRGSPSSSRQSDQSSQARALEEQMLSDREVMGMIKSLKDDPQFQKILDDPDILNAVNTGDVASLMANPQFLQLLQNPTVRDIQQKVSK
jgi:hypothetical protein